LLLERAVTESIDTQKRIPWYLFGSGHGAYAVCLESVVEIFLVDELVQLPLSPPCVKGLCALRREVIPVIAPEGLRKPQGDPPGIEPRKTVLVMQTSRGAFGILIDREGATVSEAPAEAQEARPSGGSRSVVRRRELSHEVVDPEELWKQTREQIESCFCVGGAARN
jgi:chemotaxis signal transduction protein